MRTFVVGLNKRPPSDAVCPLSTILLVQVVRDLPGPYPRPPLTPPSPRSLNGERERTVVAWNSQRHAMRFTPSPRMRSHAGRGWGEGPIQAAIAMVAAIQRSL